MVLLPEPAPSVGTQHFAYRDGSEGNVYGRVHEFLNQITEVDLWLCPEEPLLSLHPLRTTHQERDDVSGSNALITSVPRSTVVISGSGSTSEKTWTVTRLLRLFN